MDQSNKEQHKRENEHEHKHSHDHNHHHDHDHDHSGLFHSHGAATNNKSALIFALTITASIMVIEFIGGLISGSLALLSDSGHMLSDTISLVLSLIAITLATKQATKTRHYGHQRYEVLAALFNAVTLFVIAGIIVAEAIERFQTPTTVASGTMIGIAGIGLLANLLSIYVLTNKGDVEGSINLKSAYLHVLGDALGSIGAIVAGIIMLVTDWYYADPLISVFVALIILKGAWRVLKQSIHILMEGAPSSIPVTEVEQLFLQHELVSEVKEIRIWTITSNEHALTTQLVAKPKTDEQVLLSDITKQLEQRYHLKHITIQISVTQ